MIGSTDTVVTTPVPMYGFEESMLDRFTASLNRITHAFQATNVPTAITPFSVMTSRNRQARYYVRSAEASAIEYLTFSLRSELGRPSTTVDIQQSGKPNYFETMYEVFLSLSLAAMKAKARGDLTRPIIFYGAGLSGDASDPRAGRWIVQLNQIMDDPWPEPAAEPTGGALVEWGLTRHAQSLDNKFRRLAYAWKSEKLLMSSMTAIEESPHYKGIIALGEAVVPLLLRELNCDPDYWFTALNAITGEDPVPAEDRGDLLRMTEHWIAWGRRTGRLS